MSPDGGKGGRCRDLPDTRSLKGQAAAIHFSLLASCKHHAHDPWACYRDVLTRLPATLAGASEEELLKLLPHLWNPA